MKNPKKFIIDLYNRLFTEPSADNKLRRLAQDPETGKLSWSKGEMPFEDEDLNSKVIEPVFHLEDNKRKRTRTAMFKIPTSEVYEPYAKNRFQIIFPGVPEWYFSSYKYLGTDIHSQQRLLTSKKVIKDDYSEFKVLLSVGGEIDICERLVELENNPSLGDIKILMLDPVGSTIKTILIPDCEVTEIRAFRDLDYGSCGENKSDTLLYGHIVVKHKQRKLL
jgi:hypothetical protein